MEIEKFTDFFNEYVKVDLSKNQITCPLCIKDVCFYQKYNPYSKLTDIYAAFYDNVCNVLLRYSVKHYKWVRDDPKTLVYLDVWPGTKVYVDLKVELSEIFKNVTPQPPQEKKSMNLNLKKIFGRFGKATKGEFAVSVNGGVAVKRNDGTYACLIDGKLTNIDTLAVDIDAFYYLPSSLTQLRVNDMVVLGDNNVGFVVEVLNNTVSVYNVNTEAITQVKPATHFLMKEPFVTKVVSLFAMGDVAGNNNMLPMLMMMGDNKGGDMKNLLLFSMLSGGQGLNGMNPLMLMLMMGDGKEGDNDLLPLMLLMGNNNPFAGLGAGLNPNPMCACKAAAQPV